MWQSLVIVLLCGAWLLPFVAPISGDFDIYPPLPIDGRTIKSDNKRIGTTIFNDQSKRTMLALSNTIVSSFRPVLKASAVGCAIFAGYSFARTAIEAWQLHQGNNETSIIKNKSGYGGGILSDFGVSSGVIEELQKEQEELWNAVLTIHNMQDDAKQLLQTNNETVVALRVHVSNVESIFASAMSDLTKRLNLLEQDIRDGGTSSEEQIRALKMRLELAVEETRQAIDGMKSTDLPNLIAQHDTVITTKLKKFKDDLKRIIVTARKRP